MVRERVFLLMGSALMLAATGGCVNRPPVLNCTPERTTVTEGDSVTIDSKASDPDRNDRLTYNWSAAKGKLTARNGTASFDSSGLDPGTYTVKLEVSDKKPSTVNCAVDLQVEKNKMAPKVACEPGQVKVTEEQSKTLQARGSDPNDDAISYAWTVDGKSIDHTAASFEFGTTGRSLGAHTVGVTVTDVDRMTANCSFQVTIERRPNEAPTVALTLDKTSVYAGAPVTAKAEGKDPHNDELTYAWKLNGRSRSETGTKVEIATAGLSGGRHSVGVTVRDDRGATGTDTKSFSVREKLVVQVSGLRLDNVAKAKLDEVALKMQQTAALRATLTGHTDDRGSEEGNERMGLKRAQAVQKYLVQEHKIEEGRLTTASAGESAPIADNQTAQGRKENQRVEVELFVP